MTDSKQRPLKGWQSKAYAELAKFHVLEGERASIEDRIEEQRRACVRAGVSYSFGRPSVDAKEDAYACACGAVIVLDYDNRKKKAPFTCDECLALTSEAVAGDQAEEAKPPPSMADSKDIPF